MATRKKAASTKTTEFAQAADHMSNAAKEMRTAVAHQFSAVGEAMAARLGQAKKSALKQRKPGSFSAIGINRDDDIRFSRQRLDHQQNPCLLRSGIHELGTRTG